MPWLETSLMDQRMQFIVDYHRGLQSVTELAERFDISRKTAYKWLDRHEADGAAGLADRSRRPQSCPTKHPRPSSTPCSRRGAIIPGGGRRSSSAFCGGRIRGRSGRPGRPCATC